MASNALEAALRAAAAAATPTSRASVAGRASSGGSNGTASKKALKMHKPKLKLKRKRSGSVTTTEEEDPMVRAAAFQARMFEMDHALPSVSAKANNGDEMVKVQWKRKKTAPAKTAGRQQEHQGQEEAIPQVVKSKFRGRGVDSAVVAAVVPAKPVKATKTTNGKTNQKNQKKTKANKLNAGDQATTTRVGYEVKVPMTTQERKGARHSEAEVTDDGTAIQRKTGKKTNPATSATTMTARPRKSSVILATSSPQKSKQPEPSAGMIGAALLPNRKNAESMKEQNAKPVKEVVADTTKHVPSTALPTATKSEQMSTVVADATGVMAVSAPSPASAKTEADGDDQCPGTPSRRKRAKKKARKRAKNKAAPVTNGVTPATAPGVTSVPVSLLADGNIGTVATAEPISDHEATTKDAVVAVPPHLSPSSGVSAASKKKTTGPVDSAKHGENTTRSQAPKKLRADTAPALSPSRIQENGSYAGRPQSNGVTDAEHVKTIGTSVQALPENLSWDIDSLMASTMKALKSQSAISPRSNHSTVDSDDLGSADESDDDKKKGLLHTRGDASMTTAKLKAYRRTLFSQLIDEAARDRWELVEVGRLVRIFSSQWANKTQETANFLRTCCPELVSVDFLEGLGINLSSAQLLRIFECGSGTPIVLMNKIASAVENGHLSVRDKVVLDFLAHKTDSMSLNQEVVLFLMPLLESLSKVEEAGCLLKSICEHWHLDRTTSLMQDILLTPVFDDLDGCQDEILLDMPELEGRLDFPSRLDDEDADENGNLRGLITNDDSDVGEECRMSEDEEPETALGDVASDNDDDDDSHADDSVYEGETDSDEEKEAAMRWGAKSSPSKRRRSRFILDEADEDDGEDEDDNDDFIASEDESDNSDGYRELSDGDSDNDSNSQSRMRKRLKQK